MVRWPARLIGGVRRLTHATVAISAFARCFLSARSYDPARGAAPVDSRPEYLPNGLGTISFEPSPSPDRAGTLIRSSRPRENSQNGRRVPCIFGPVRFVRLGFDDLGLSPISEPQNWKPMRSTQTTRCIDLGSRVSRLG